MNFIKQISYLLVAPSLGWSEIKKFSIPKEQLLSRVYYPLLAILALTPFVSFLYGNQHSLSEYLQMSVCCVGVFFFGYMISSYLFCSVFLNKETQKGEINKVHNFVIYNYSILMLFAIISNLSPIKITLFDILPCYILFIVWCGYKYFDLTITQPKFMALASLIILIPYFALKFLLNLFIV